MKDLLTRPNFFPGQWIDYRDFNRLSEQPDRVISHLCRHLFEGGGVIVNALQELQVKPLDGLRVGVHPGVALLPNGQLAILDKEAIVDLSPYVGNSESALVVSLRRVVRGSDRYEDTEDPSIRGYRSEIAEPEIVFGQAVPSDGIEIFRVALTPSCNGLRLPDASEEWGGDFAPAADRAVIDLRHRSRIVPQTYAPLSTNNLIQVRQALYEIDRLTRKIQQRYAIQDGFGAGQYLIQLHAELLAKPFQPLKASFLLSELGEKLGLYLEHLLNRVGSQRSDLDRNALLAAIALTERMRSREVLPRGFSCDLLPELGAQLRQALEFAEQRFDLTRLIQDALAEVSAQLFPLEPRVSLAGRVFRRTDILSTESAERLAVVGTDAYSQRTVETRFASGDRLSLKGTFLKSGNLSLDFEIADADQPAVLLMRQYLRRGRAAVRYEINGRGLAADRAEGIAQPNTWFNRGLVIPADFLLPKGNRLRVTVENADLDFGFFDLAVYQPLLEMAEAK